MLSKYFTVVIQLTFINSFDKTKSMLFLAKTENRERNRAETANRNTHQLETEKPKFFGIKTEK